MSQRRLPVRISAALLAVLLVLWLCGTAALAAQPAAESPDEVATTSLPLEEDGPPEPDAPPPPEEPSEPQLPQPEGPAGQPGDEAGTQAAAGTITPFSVLPGPTAVSSIFPDATLAAYIAGRLGVGVNDTVSQNQLNGIQNLQPPQATHNLEGIQYLNGLREVRIDNLQLTQRIPEAFVADIYPNLNFYSANNQNVDLGTYYLDNPTLQQIYDDIPPLFIQIAENSGGAEVGTWTIKTADNAVIASFPAVNGSELLAYTDLAVGTHDIELVLNNNAWLGFNGSIYRFRVVFEGITTGDLQGTVTDQNGAPLQGVTITLGSGQTTTTNAQGQYSFTGLPTGNYTVTATLAGYNSQTKPGTVSAGETTQVDFVLVRQTGTANVLVLDELTGEPVAGATVVLVQEDGSGSYTATTDAFGNATFTNLPSGIYRPVASHPEYTTETTTAQGVGPGATTEFTVYLGPVRYTLSGTVYEQGNGPISGATVTIPGVGSVVTDAGGNYTIQVPAGSYEGTASAPSHGSQTDAIQVDGDTLHNFYLVPDPGTVTVIAYFGAEADGVRAPGVSLTLTPGGTQQTGANGEYSYTLQPGSYTLAAALEGYTVVYSEQSFTIASGVPHTDIILELYPIMATLQGTVFDAVTLEPIPFASVVLSTGESTTAGADGTYTFAEVPYGSHVVTGSSTGYASDARAVQVASSAPVTQNLYLNPQPVDLVVRVYYVGSGAPAAGATVTLNDGHTATMGADGSYTFSLAPGTYSGVASLGGYATDAQNVTLAPGAPGEMIFYLYLPPALVGNVRDLDSRVEIEGATVTIILDGSGTTFTTTTDAEGNYSFEDLPEGTYTVSVSAPGYNSVSRPGIEVPAGQVTNASFFLVPQLGSLTGTVTYANGSPVAGAQITLSNNATAITDGNGQYFFVLPAGDYSVAEHMDGYTDQTKPADIEPAATTVVNFVLDALPGSLSGTVTDANGNPVAGATVSIVVNGTTVSTTTQADGTYSIDNVPPGTYTVVAGKEGYATQAKRDNVVSEQDTVVDFMLDDSPGILEGTVTDAATGRPIPGATITIGPDGIVITTDANGYYRIPLEQGSYTVTAEVSGYPSQTASADIVPGQPVRRNFVFGTPPTGGGGGDGGAGSAGSTGGVATGDTAATGAFVALALGMAACSLLLWRRRRAGR